MASLIGSLYVSLTANVSPFTQGFKSAESAVASSTAGIRRSLGVTERSVSGLQRTMSSGIKPYALISAARTFDTVQQRANLLRGSLLAVTAAFGGIGAALTSNVVSRYLDTFKNLENQVRVVSDGQADLAAQMEQVQKVAERSRSSLSAVGTLYARLSKAAPEDGASKLLRRVETINKALQLGGATAQEAASAAIQFSQAIQSNRLGGDELRAVLETPLGTELAKGMGITIGKLRELSKEGKLTSDVLFKSLDKIADTIDTKFAKSLSTIDQALTVADGKIVMYAGSLDAAYGITRLLTGAINSFGDNLNTIIPLLGVVGAALGVVFAGRLGGSIIGGNFNKIVSGIDNVIDAQKRELNLAKDLVYASSAQEKAAKSAAAAAALASGGDTNLMASKASLKALLQNETALAKIQEGQLTNLRAQRDAREKIKSVSAETTSAMTSSAQKMLDAQNKINELRAKGVVLSTQEAAAHAAASKTFTVSTPGYQETQRVAQAEQDLIRIKKERAALDTQIATQQAKYKEADVQLTNATIQSEDAAQRKRVANFRDLIALQNKSENLRIAGLNQGAKVDLSKNVVKTEGLEAVATQSALAARGIQSAEIASLRAAAGLAAAQRATSSLALGFGLVKSAGLSLVGFLGGPWGVALTVAAAAFTIFGIRAQEAAQKVAASRQALQDELDRLGNSDTAKTPDQELALNESRLAGEKAQLKNLLEGLQTTRNDLAVAVIDLVKDPRVISMGGDIENRITDLGTTFQTTDMTLNQLKKNLLNLKVNPDLIHNAIDGVQSTVKEGQTAQDTYYQLEVAIEEVQKRLAELDNSHIELTVKVKVDDPSGLFTPREQNFGKALNPEGMPALKNADNLLTQPPDLQQSEADRFRHESLVEGQGIGEKEMRDLAAQIYEAHRGEITFDQATQIAEEQWRIHNPPVQNPLDPANISKYPPSDLNRDYQQRKLYGGAQSAMQQQAELQRKRNELLAEAGDTGDKALNTPAKVAAKEQELLEKGYAKTREAAHTLAQNQLDLAEKTRLANKEASSGTKDWESFTNKLKELKEQGDASFLSDLDRKVVDFAKSLKDGSGMMNEYIAAVKSGDLSKAPTELLQAREALIRIGAGETWRGLLQKYGEGAQLTQTFADKQAELAYLLNQGAITADQATIAYTDFLTGFGKYEWIDKASSAITDFASSAIDDFDNIGDAFKSLAKNLLKIAADELVLKPLEANLRNFFSAIVGGGNMAGAAPSGFNLIGSLLGRSSAPSASAGVTSAGATSAVASAVKPIATAFTGQVKSGLGSVASYIQSAAIARNIDPAVALKVARSEGLGPGIWQSNYVKNGFREPSYGPFQLLKGGPGTGFPTGMGNAFQKATGLDPADPSTVKQQVDFALDNAAKNGWGAWYGAKAVGVGNREGLNGASPRGIDPQVTSSVSDLGKSAASTSKNVTGLGENITKATDSVGKAATSITKALPAFGSKDSWAALASPNFQGSQTGFFDMLGGKASDYQGIGGAGLIGNGGMLGGSGGLLGGIGNIFSGLIGGIGKLVSGLFSGGSSILSSIFGGSGILGSIFSLFFHEGGKVGAGGSGKMMPVGAFAGAPKLHSGLKSDEFAAILQKGERVLTARDEHRTMSTMSKLARSSSEGGGGKQIHLQQSFHIAGAITQKDVIDMVQGGVHQAVETSKRSFPGWQVEFGKSGAFA